MDRREFFWEDQHEFQPGEFFEALLKQVYLNSKYIPGLIHVPADFEEREELEEFLSELRGRKVEIVDAAARFEESYADVGRDECQA